MVYILTYIDIELGILPNYERSPCNNSDWRGMPTGDAHSSGHLVPSYLGFAYVLFVETNRFQELVVDYPDYAHRRSLGTYSISWHTYIFINRRIHSMLDMVIVTTQSIVLWVRIPQNASKNQTDTKYKFNNLIIYKE